MLRRAQVLKLLASCIVYFFIVIPAIATIMKLTEANFEISPVKELKYFIIFTGFASLALLGFLLITSFLSLGFNALNGPHSDYFISKKFPKNFKKKVWKYFIWKEESDNLPE